MLAYVLFAGVLTLVFFYVKHVFSYWQRLGFPYVRPVIPIGSLGPIIRKQKSIGEFIRDLHLLKRKDPVLGFYFLYRPVLLVRELSLINRILVTDFDHFTDRGIYYDEKNDPIGAHLFAMPGEAWKTLRAKFSPTFSPAKLKAMFHNILEKNEEMTGYLDECVANGEHLQMKLFVLKLTLNIIASVFFGFELNTYAEPNHPFANIANTFMDNTIIRQNVVLLCTFLCPDLMKRLGIPFLSPEVANYVRDLFQTALENRRKDPSTKRNDFIQTVMELMEEERNSKESYLESDQSGVTTRLSPEKCAAQAFVFYLAGFETTSSTIAYTLWELARNPEWMSKAREEVDDIMEKRNGKLQFEDMSELKVLDKCIREGLRKYPVVPLLNRECTKEYTIPELNLTIPKGTGIFVSNMGINMDPDINADPEVFNPDRYQEDSNDEPWAYGFGLGPRYCIGKRMGTIMVGLALASLIHKYDWKTVDDKIVLGNFGVFLTDRHDVRMRASKRIFK